MRVSSLPSNSLFCSIVTLYILIFLYLPPIFLKLAISPTLISTIILLLSLLRLGVSQQPPSPQPPCENLVEGQVEPNRLEAQSSTWFDKSFEFESEEFETSALIARERSQVDSSQEEANGEAEPSQLESQTSPRLKKVFESESESESESKCIPLTNERSHIDITSQEETIVEPRCTSSGSQTTIHPITRPESKECDMNGQQLEESKRVDNVLDPDNDPSPYCSTFVEWDVWAPLEIIYETFEGEEDEEENKNDTLNNHYYIKAVESYTSLSRYFPDTDTDTDSSDEGEREGLIEIALDYYGYNNDDHINKGMIMKKLTKEVEVDDEDNLIEIDISPTRSNEFYW